MTEAAAMLDREVLARAASDAMWAEDNASRALGMTLTATGPGTATLTMPIVKTMTNGHGMCHGGYIFTLADSAFAFACSSRVLVPSFADMEAEWSTTMSKSLRSSPARSGSASAKATAAKASAIRISERISRRRLNNAEAFFSVKIFDQRKYAVTGFFLGLTFRK